MFSVGNGHRALVALALAALTGAAIAVGPLSVAAPAQAAQSPAACNASVALLNGGFENPVVAGNAQLPDASVPGWATTASDKAIEIWRTPFGGVTAGSEFQFAELNATQASTLYQDIATSPGQSLRWELQHRGRAGTDVMAVLIGTPSGPLVTQQTLSDGTSGWGTYAGLYTVPAGQTTTRFAFQAVSTATGNASIGNFLDSISFGTSACVVVTKSVVNTSGSATTHIGDVLTYTVAASNNGGNPANLTELVDALPAGLAFVPGSITTTSPSGTVAVTDAAADDVGEFGGGAVHVRIGTGASQTTGGSVAAGETHSMSFQARVTTAAALTSLSNTATATYHDDLAKQDRTSTSNTVVTPVAAAADLSVTQSLDTPLLAGTTAGYSIVVANDGPQAGSGVTLTSTLPPLTGVTAPGCTVTLDQLVCDVGTLASGASTTFVVTGTVPAAVPVGTDYTLSSKVTGQLDDPTPGNNAASRTDSTTASADLSLKLSSTPTTPTGGGTVDYAVVVTNSGPSTAHKIVITNPIAPSDTVVDASIPGGTCDVAGGSVVCTIDDLAPGSSVTATITVTVAAGATSVTNSAQVDSSTPDPDPSNNSDSITLASVNPALTIVTQGAVAPASHQLAAELGDSIQWTYSVTNTGDVAVGSIAITDPEGGVATCVPTLLQPGETALCTGPLATSVSEADILAGSISNGATASGVPVAGPATVESASSTATIATQPVAAAIRLQTTIANLTSLVPGARIMPGTSLGATYLVTNTGVVTLHGIVVSDPLFGPVDCPVATLAPGESTTCTAVAPYTVTPTDGTAGVISASTTVTGAPPRGSGVSDVTAADLDLVAVTNPTVPGDPPVTPSGLASTGADIASAATVAALLFGFGLFALAAGRLARRRPRHRN